MKSSCGTRLFLKPLLRLLLLIVQVRGAACFLITVVRTDCSQHHGGSSVLLGNRRHRRQPPRWDTMIPQQPTSAAAKGEMDLCARRRSTSLSMGGYYVEPQDKKPLQFDHMVFGVPCKERRIDLDPVMAKDNGSGNNKGFVVLDMVEEENSDDNEKAADLGDVDSEEVLLRLAHYLMANRAAVVEGKKVVVLGSNWISLLVARLGASSVLVWDHISIDDDEDDDKKQRFSSLSSRSNRVEARLRILQYTDQFIQQSPPNAPKVQTTTRGENLIRAGEFFDADVVLLTTRSFLENLDISDDLRRTDATILMSQESMEVCSYQQRSEEGADVVVW